MRALSPNSAGSAIDYFQRGFDAQSTADALNLTRPEQPAYQADDIRKFREFIALQDWPQHNNAPFVPAPASSSVIHAPAPMSPWQHIAHFEGQEPSPANMDGRVGSRNAELNPRYSQDVLARARIEQRNPQDLSSAPLPSGHSVNSRATGSTQDARHSDADGQYSPRSVPSSSNAIVTKLRRKERRMAPPYPPSKSSGSGPTTIDAGTCKHPSRASINTDTFVACHVTDDELTKGDKKAISRVKTRKNAYKRAAEQGLSSTAELRRLELDAGAAKRGHASRQEAEQARLDQLAAAKGLSRQEVQRARLDQLAAAKGLNRHEAERARRDQLAAAKGLSRQKADLAQLDKRAAAKGLSRQEAKRIERDDLAVLQLGQGTTRSDLARIQRTERALAAKRGIDVKDIRSARMPVNSASPSPPAPLFPQFHSDSVRPIVALQSFEQALSRSWNAGDRFTITLQDEPESLYVVTRHRHGGEERYENDFLRQLRGG